MSATVASRAARTTAKLRVAVDPDLLRLASMAQTGTGKMWHHVLVGLGERVTLQEPMVAPRRFGVRSRLRRPDVYLTNGHVPPPDSPGAPLVVQVHEVGWIDPELRAMLDPTFLAQIEPGTEAAVRAASHVITPSRSAADEVIAAYGIAPERVHPVAHGVDLDLFSPARRDPSVRPAGGRPYVLFVATVHPRKNLTALRNAMTGLADRGFAHALVLVVGPALDRVDWAQLEAEAVADLPGHAGRVVRVEAPSEAELAALYVGAAACCLPSFSEGFGLPALEAMACGTPVVVSDRGSLPEVVGDAGLVVAPTAEAVEDALARVLGDEAVAASLRTAGRRRAEGFPWRRTVDGWLAVLEQAAQERR